MSDNQDEGALFSETQVDDSDDQTEVRMSPRESIVHRASASRRQNKPLFGITQPQPATVRLAANANHDEEGVFSEHTVVMHPRREEYSSNDMNGV